MVAALLAADSAPWAALLSQNWAHQQALDPRMCTEEMARAGARNDRRRCAGGKAAGSGAGGCMFFLARTIPSAVIDAARALDVRLLPVRWAMRGVHQC